MRCPHGKETDARFILGVNLHMHDDGSECDLLNRLNVECEALHLANMERAIREAHPLGHMLCLAHAVYKTSPVVRFAYLGSLSTRDVAGFVAGFAPIRLAMAGEEGHATLGLYLMELYFAFDGITNRINAANPRLPATTMYQFLGSLGIDRVIKQENEHTRAYATLLDTGFPAYKATLSIPGFPCPAEE